MDEDGLVDETQVRNSNIAQKSEKSRKFLKMRLASPRPRISLVKKDPPWVGRGGVRKSLRTFW